MYTVPFHPSFLAHATASRSRTHHTWTRLSSSSISRSVFRRTAAPSDRESLCRFFFAQSTVLEFFAMLISRPILRYEYYQIYCVLAALFSRFAFLSSEHSLLRISVSPCVSPATLARRRVSMCLSSHVVTERRSSSSLSSSASAIILALCKRRREESPLFSLL